MQAGALSLHPRAIGQASALLGFGQLAIAGILAAGFARLTTGSSFSLALGMSFCAAMALLVVWTSVGRAPAGP
jgi:F0F1-type ATP synthase assembly protein I